ncbi:sensor histidine kinase [Microbacterium sp.]|uniref:sensor histidine kinase n=1 Tax=Microbacterium sp. TaxID=51671 RepID=UPI002639461E|nr:sensor histidine kinase [Microbacterium sp.]
MLTSPRRSSSLREEDELRLPRPPGVIRRFWARHPVAGDVVIALVCLLLSAAPATIFTSSRTTSDGGFAVVDAPPLAMAITITVLVMLACALLIRRRRWPLASFVAAYVVAHAYLLLLEPAGGPLLLVASYTLAVHRSTRAAWIGLAAGMGSLTLFSLLLHWTGIITVQIALNGILGQLTLALIGTLIGANVGGRKRYIEAVIDRSRQLLTERDQHAQIAAAAERARIAREMHDIVSHSLTVIVALSEGAAATEDRGQGRAAAAAAAETARGALTEMRAMLGVLRDGGADVPLAPADPVDPRDTVTAAQRAGFPATLTIKGKPGASAATRYAIGRIVQEGVTNAMRHAPRASTIAVSIEHTDTAVTVLVDNDGVTGPTGIRGFGLRGLHERASHLNGELRSESVGEGRWSLHATLPADQPAAEQRENEES